MPTSKVARLVPSMPGAGRRQQYSASTKRSLVDVAEQLFTEHGYASTSLDAIVAGAAVTKGALYHHFSGKQAVFEAVFDRVETDSSRLISRSLKGLRDPREKAQAGLRAFLEVVREPRYRRIVIQEGPAVLGYERFREQEQRSTFATVLDIVRSVTSTGTIEMDEELLQTFARIFFGAMSSAGELVATAEDPEGAAWRVEAAIGLILRGFQALAETDPPIDLWSLPGLGAAPGASAAADDPDDADDAGA